MYDLLIFDCFSVLYGLIPSCTFIIFFILFPTCTNCFKHFQTCTISMARKFYYFTEWSKNSKVKYMICTYHLFSTLHIYGNIGQTLWIVFFTIIGFDKTLYFFLLKIKVYDKTHLYGYFNLGHLPPVRLLEFSLFPPSTLIPSCTFINF